jgi:hypothetical protein
MLGSCGKALLLRGGPRPFILLRQQPAAVAAAAAGSGTLFEQRRGMARGRNYYVRGASNKDDISQEARDLLLNQR